MRTLAQHLPLLLAAALLTLFTLPQPTYYSVTWDESAQPIYWVYAHDWPLGQRTHLVAGFEDKKTAWAYAHELRSGAARPGPAD